MNDIAKFLTGILWLLILTVVSNTPVFSHPSFDEIAIKNDINYPEIIVQYEKERNIEQLSYYCKEWYKSGNYSTGLLAWNYNNLVGINENAILLTQGDNDTHPIWLLQYAKDIRKDVTVFNLQLLKDKQYRNLLFAENGIAAMPDSETDLVAYIVAHKPEKRDIYISVTTNPDERKKLEKELYLVGLSLKYSKKSIDNIAIIKNNYENKFLFDNMTVDFSNDVNQPLVDKFNLNYLPAFILLQKHYSASGETMKSQKLETLIKTIAKKGGKEKALENYFAKNEVIKPKVDISIRDIDKKIVKISNGLYAWSTEVSNEEYELFLTDLLKRREYEKIGEYKIGKADWRSYLPDYLANIPDSKLYDRWKPEDANMPVQNISLAAAEAYCEWLTDAYNSSSYKRKDHKKVVFRLPTKDEWIFAAEGGHKGVKYSWGGNYPQNSHGCWLSNFNVFDAAPCETCKFSIGSRDGGFFTVPIGSYFPNEYGLFGFTGNVAEMVQGGLAMGGSWNDTPENSTIQSTQKADEPKPWIGFRVFMEVIK